MTNRMSIADRVALVGIQPVRCAIYTRKSSDDGLEQDFNSLDAQRESAENYIASQKHSGWTCLPDLYDDGGFTGGNMERPAVQKLMADIQAGRVDCVVVYKVDRLSRSLMDFSRMMSEFDRHKVSFVSVTQQFNTTHSMGRLTLNILLSFAQFERELISERTRDKIALSRKKGRWGGGPPILGYDIEVLPGGNRLVVNQREAKLVREIFDLYLECKSVQKAIRQLDERGIKKKAYTTKAGIAKGGSGFEKSTMFKMLTNVAYIGKVRHKTEVYDGLQEGIVEDDVFHRVGDLLRENRVKEGKGYSNKHGALLRGLVRCKACGCAMGHHFATDGPKRYRYYVCQRAQKRGWKECPGPSLPAFELEKFVIDQLRSLGKDNGMVSASVVQAQERLRARAATMETDLEPTKDLLKRRRGDLRAVAESGGATAHLDELRAEVRGLALDVRKLESRIKAINARVLDEDELAGAIESFDPLWEHLTNQERERMVQLLVRLVEYDAVTESISVTFHDGTFTDPEETDE